MAGPAGSQNSGVADRTLVVWCPDWPVHAALHAAELPSDGPAAVLDRGRVLASNAAARGEGVRRDMRMREAQSRCPELVTLAYDEAADARAFEPIVVAVDQISPGVSVIRPGTCAVRAKGPSRYYGGEEQAAAVIAEHLVGLGIPDCRFGVADSAFAAEQAARQAEVQTSVVVPVGRSGVFLRDMAVDLLGDPALVSLLRRLGLRTLGSFAALTSADVLSRFGQPGLFAHRLAAGADSRPMTLRRPAPELERGIDFEPPLEQVDPVAFSVRDTAERFVNGLATQGLVCTTVRIEVTSDARELHERQWLHPRWFDAVDLVDRVRWQLQGSVRQLAGPSHGGASRGGDSRGGAGPATSLTAPVTRVHFVPVDVASVGGHADGLWGSGPDERIHRAMSRVQSMLGHDAVVSAVVSGGRSPAERQTLVPWGDRAVPARRYDLPWPGSLPPPAPATVYREVRPAVVLGRTGQTVDLNDRGVLTGAPERFSPDGTSPRPVQAWAGPWPVEERWWDDTAARRVARFQVVDVDGSAWLLLVENGTWWVEARYD